MDLVEKAKNFVAEKVANMEKPEANITDVDLQEVGMSGITYLAKISVSNPYSVPIPIGEIKYTLKSVDRVIASGNIPDPGSLKGNDNTMLNVEIKETLHFLFLKRAIGIVELGQFCFTEIIHICRGLFPSHLHILAIFYALSIGCKEIRELKESVSKSYLDQLSELRESLEAKEKELADLNRISDEQKHGIEDLNERLSVSVQSCVEANEIINR
ncbi:WHy domain-containing protein [Forsythia ovata]|uniref:WHy domain-containing protein n=1 Tax=Forsythia ovata TaxID=205694 RepID=A0ABD1Q048_9LAMI